MQQVSEGMDLTQRREDAKGEQTTSPAAGLRWNKIAKTLPPGVNSWKLRSVRDLFKTAFTPDAILDLTDEMDQLAGAYVAQGVVTPKYEDDAWHVAVCTALRLDYLVSWNFRHLVNVQREAGFNGVNLLKGYAPVRIVNPLELIYGKQEESL